MDNTLRDEYFKWMCDLVLSKSYSSKLTYNQLMMELHNIRFTYILDLDGNRYADGINLRYIFGYKVGYSDKVIKKELDLGPCSVLEMMVALAYRIEDQIMDDYDYGDRTGQWFWNMIVSLGLGHMSDYNFDKRYVDDIIFRFLDRDYEPNGAGGLFTLEHPKYDLRNEEIWYQAMWYLDENFDFTI